MVTLFVNYAKINSSWDLLSLLKIVIIQKSIVYRFFLLLIALLHQKTPLNFKLHQEYMKLVNYLQSMLDSRNSHYKYLKMKKNP